MANSSYVQSLLGGLATDMRAAFKNVFDYVLQNLRFGPVAHQTRAENFQAYYLTSTTPATANQEFSIAHGLGIKPYVLLSVLPLDQVGAATVDLQVSRAADNSRIYLKSPSTSAVVYVLVE
jgi:hypothetical protein